MSNIVNLFWKEKKTFGNEKNIIYQIYGDHLIYGNHALLYIGKTNDCNNGDEIIEENINWVNYEQNVKIYFTKLANYDTEIIEDIKLLLQFSHSPTYNTKYLCWKKEYDKKELIVRNYGLKGVLLPEISFEYWSCFYKYGGWSKNAEYKNNK